MVKQKSQDVDQSASLVDLDGLNPSNESTASQNSGQHQAHVAEMVANLDLNKH